MEFAIGVTRYGQDGDMEVRLNDGTFNVSNPNGKAVGKAHLFHYEPQDQFAYIVDLDKIEIKDAKVVRLTVEEGAVDITDLPEGIQIVVKNIDQDCGMEGEEVHESTFQSVNNEVERIAFESYDLEDSNEDQSDS